MRQMAVITPYAQFLFRFISETPEYDLYLSVFLLLYHIALSVYVQHYSSYSIFFSCRKNVTIRFTRRTDVMPPIPIETKHHPSSVDLLLIKRLVTDTSKKTLLQFLQNEFVNINKTLATRLIGKYGIILICYKSLKLCNIPHHNTFIGPFTWRPGQWK